jgi:type I restriction enzyme S subunit
MNNLNSLIKKMCPNGVPRVKIKDIALEMFRGSGIRREDISEEGIPCIRYGEIYTSYGVFFKKCLSHVDPSKVPCKKVLKKNDILFAITGEKVIDIGKCTAYVGDEEGLVGGDILVLRHKQNAKYLSYVLSTKDAIEQKGRGRVKSKVVHTNADSIGNISIPLPPINVQDAIVTFLDKFVYLREELLLELDLRDRQYEYYLNQILSFDDEEEK